MRQQTQHRERDRAAKEMEAGMSLDCQFGKAVLDAGWKTGVELVQGLQPAYALGMPASRWGNQNIMVFRQQPIYLKKTL